MDKSYCKVFNIGQNSNFFCTISELWIPWTSSQSLPIHSITFLQYANVITVSGFQSKDRP